MQLEKPSVKYKGFSDSHYAYPYAQDEQLEVPKYVEPKTYLMLTQDNMKFSFFWMFSWQILRFTQPFDSLKYTLIIYVLLICVRIKSFLHFSGNLAYPKARASKVHKPVHKLKVRVRGLHKSCVAYAAAKPNKEKNQKKGVA